MIPLRFIDIYSWVKDVVLISSLWTENDKISILNSCYIAIEIFEIWIIIDINLIYS